jgi:hypothetical protein
MSRLRRLVVSNRFFFITCRLLPHRGRLSGRHLNPVRAGWVEGAEDRLWPSVRD